MFAEDKLGDRSSWCSLKTEQKVDGLYQKIIYMQMSNVLRVRQFAKT